MLYTGHLDGVQFYECRDCHVIVAVGAQDPNTPGQRFGRIISRSLGKTCSNCGSFEITWQAQAPSHPTRESGYRCNDCGVFWGK
jgi:DNA-directed RNA polymerase subunit RPC12/RpoP